MDGDLEDFMFDNPTNQAQTEPKKSEENNGGLDFNEGGDETRAAS
jgi:hypothetical protein